MRGPRATVMVLIPGRSTLTFELDGRIGHALMAALLVPFMLGATARRCVDAWYGRAPSIAALFSAHPVRGSLALVDPRDDEPSRTQTHMALLAAAMPKMSMTMLGPEMPESPRPIPSGLAPSAPSGAGRANLDPERAEALAHGLLRLDAVHLGESVQVTPFDASGAPQTPAFDALKHLMRCRVTSDEAPIDPRLIRILTQLSGLYGRPIQLVSGHRKAHAIGTKPTSQHVLGRAADIRIAGVGIEELRSVAMQLGARGVGIYPEKGFVHVDVREKPKYFWTYSADEGEEADSRPAGRVARAARLLTAVVE